MKFTPTWRTSDVSDIPSFKELEDITGMAYDENGVYSGPKEKPDMQLVIDQRTKRQYWAPKEYDEEAIRYGMAKLEKDFNSKEWWGMVQNPDLSFTEKISTAYIEGLKQAGKLVANAPTKIAGAVAGATDAFGIDAGAAVMASLKMNPIFLASNVSRKGLKATAEDYVQLFKDLKTPKGKMGTTASYWRATANNWEETVNKYLPDVDENVKAHSTMVAIGGLAGQIGGSLLIAAATNGVGGLPAVAAVFGGQQFYDIREEYLQKGYDLDAANIFAGFAALSEGGLEAVGFGNLLKYGTLSRSFRNTLIGGLIESVQEMSQTSAEELITNLSGVREETIAQILTQIAISGVAGFIPGMGFSLMVGGENIAQEKAAYELDRAVEQQQQKALPVKEGQTLPGTTPKQELELAKANKGSNPVYETVKNIANAHGVTDEKAIDAFYYFARNQALQGKLGEQLLEGLGKQIVAYKNQLSGMDKQADQDNKNAAEAIKQHLSAENAQEYHDANVKAMEESGIEKTKAEVAAAQLDTIYKNLSEKLGVDLQKFKQVIVRALPSRNVQQATEQEPGEINAIQGQIKSLEKLGTPEALAQKERLQAELDEKVEQEGKRGYIKIGDLVNEIALGKMSDVSTLQHEMMHHFRNVINLLAAQGNKNAVSLKKQMDSIIEKNKYYVKQDINKEEEVLSEAYEAWLYGGVVAENPTQQKLFDALKQFFNDIYDSVKAITGIRIDPEIDMFFRQLTGQMDIQQQSESSKDLESVKDEIKLLEYKAHEEDKKAKPAPKKIKTSYTNSEQKENIEDAGEFLMGNKKENKSLSWDELKDMNDLLREKNTTKSKVYEMPPFEDFKKEQGFNDRQAAFVYRVYASINNKPSKKARGEAKENQRIFTENVKKVMDATISWAKENKDVLTNLEKQTFPLDNALIDKIFPIKEGERRFYDHADYNRIALILGGEKFLEGIRIHSWDIKLIDDLAKKLQTEKENKKSEKEEYEKVFRVVENYNGKFFVAGAKNNLVYSKVDFETKEAAEQYAKDLYERVKPFLPNNRNLVDFSNLREGISRRKEGENISPQGLIDTFGFRGVNFGNWTKQKERQDFLNLTYDSLFDLAEILNLPPKALSFGGTLGLAYGAQGHAGAKAHYLPAYHEINLTRKNGMGSLAHEWFHALDYHFGNLVEGKDFSGKNITNATSEGKARKEVYDAFQNLVKKMKERPITKEELAEKEKKFVEQQNNRIKQYIEYYILPTYREGERKENVKKILANELKKDIWTMKDVARIYEAISLRKNAKMKMGLKLTDKEAALIWISSAKERIQKVKTLVKATKDTKFLSDAKKLDKAEKKAYWTENTELGARAFTSYIIDKISASENRNDFLAKEHGYAIDSEAFSEALKKDSNANPREFMTVGAEPHGKERTAINKAFDKLFETIKVRETDKGITLYQDPKKPNVYFQPGYHGGAAKFEKFDLQFVGTGEGAQAHGWGVYIAGSRETAEGYRERTVLGRGINREYEFFIGDKKLDAETSFLINNNISTSTLKEAAKGDKEELRNAFKSVIGEWKKTFVELLEDLRARRDFILANPKMSLAAYAKKYNDSRTKYALQNAREVAKTFNSRANIQNVLAQLEESIKIYEGYYDRNLKNAAALEAIDLDKLSVRRDEGQLYEVEIPENDVLLDEMKHFGEQPKKVQDALLKIQKDYPDTRLGQRGLWIYQDLVKQGPYSTKKENQKWASLTMLKYGIEGITYEGFRDGRCYVIFNDKAVRIQRTFYQTDRAQRTGAKAADPKPSKERIAKDIEVIRNNGVEKYQPKSRVAESVGNFAKHILLSVRQRAGAIDNKLKAFFDKLDYFQPNLEKKFASRANGFIKKFQGLTENEKNEFDYYVYNQCNEELQKFLKEKGMTEEYNEVRQLLNFIYAISNQAGIDMGFIEEYFPTSMIDYAGFLDHLKGTDKWSYIAKALREADPEGRWSDKEKADAVNKLLRGYRLDPVNKPANAKDRTILYKSPELMKFYEHSDVALIKYLQGMSQALAINKAFGKGKGFNTDETIGAIVLDLINSGTITNKEEAEVKKLLKSRLSYGATPEFISMVKNIGYLQTMNNITSAVTQLGDLYAPFYKYSFGTAIQAIFGKSEITKTDLGLDKIWEEFSDSSKTGIAVDKLFKVIGLEKMDGFGKNVAINASLINLRKQAASGDIALTERLAYTFGKDAGKVLADIKAGNITDDVKILIWSDLADTQPIGRSGVPTGYLDNPHGRLFYQLKTFSLNQISLFYADSLVNIQKGIKYGNKKQFLKGVQNGFKLLLLLTAGNAGADVLKNIIMGREIDISDTVVSNLLWNIGVSKYTFYKGKRDGYARAILSSYVMPPQVSAMDDTWIDIRNISSGKKQLKDSASVAYLPFGRAYYWWFGGGSKEGKARTEKMKKKAAAKNRRKKKKK